MKTFKYRYTKLTTGFIYAGLALAAVAFGLNVFAVFTEHISESAIPAFDIIRYILLFAVSVAMFIILISLLTSSYYSVDEKTLKTSFGVIKSKYELENVDSVILDRTTNKLSVYFKNESFIVIVVKPEWYDEFITAILEANPKIDYSIKSKENSPDDEPKK